MSKSDKTTTIRLTEHQEIAFRRLENFGFNKRKLIDKAIDEMLYRDYRNLLAQAKVKAEKQMQQPKRWRLADHVCSMSFPPKPYDKY